MTAKVIRLHDPEVLFLRLARQAGIERAEEIIAEMIEERKPKLRLVEDEDDSR